MKTQNNKNSINPVAKFASIFALAALIALASGCGGGGSALTSNPTQLQPRWGQLRPSPLWRCACRQRDFL